MESIQKTLQSLIQYRGRSMKILTLLESNKLSREEQVKWAKNVDPLSTEMIYYFFDYDEYAHPVGLNPLITSNSPLGDHVPIPDNPYQNLDMDVIHYLLTKPSTLYDGDNDKNYRWITYIDLVKLLLPNNTLAQKKYITYYKKYKNLH